MSYLNPIVVLLCPVIATVKITMLEIQDEATAVEEVESKVICVNKAQSNLVLW